MRVLVLSSETPCYPGSGGQTRQHSLLEPLAARHEVRVIATGAPAPFGQLPKGVAVRMVQPGPERPPAGGGWLRRNMVHASSGEPWHYQFEGHDTDAIAAVLVGELHDHRPDVVQVEHSQLSPLLHLLPDDMPSVLVLHNLAFTMVDSLLGARAPRGRLGLGVETWVTARAERQAMRRASRVVVVTPRDGRVARRLAPGAHVDVVPNCLPVDAFAAARAPAGDPTVVFTASFFWPPNDAAARRLLGLLPGLRGQVPGARLELVGRGMSPELVELARATAGADPVGEVADVRPHLAAAWVAAAPLDHAGGSQLKVLEALAAGLPVVTTPRVTDALELGRGDGVVSAVSDAEFLGELARLLHQPTLLKSMGEAGRVAAARFDRERVAPLQERTWELAVRGR